MYNNRDTETRCCNDLLGIESTAVPTLSQKLKCTTFSSATYCCEQYLKYYYANRPTQNTYHRLRRHRHPSWTCACGNGASCCRPSWHCAWPNAGPTSSCRPSWRRPSCATNVSWAPWCNRLETTIQLGDNFCESRNRETNQTETPSLKKSTNNM